MFKSSESLRQRLLGPYPGFPIIAAHRGVPDLVPENTLPSFAAAWEQGAEMIEIDIQRTSDHHLVVIHDPTVDRTTEGRGMVKDLTLAQLERLNASAGFKDHSYPPTRIPTLVEVMEWARGKVWLNLEIKNAPFLYPGLEQQVAQMVMDYHMEDQVLLSSFDHLRLAEVTRDFPLLMTGLLYYSRPLNPAEEARAAGAIASHPHLHFASRELIASLQKENIRTVVWTVDEEKEMELLITWQVDVIITNHPAVLQRLRGKQKNGNNS